MRSAQGHCLYKGGKKGFKQSPYLQELACYMGQAVPFDEGSCLLHKLKGITLTDKQIERLTHHYGQLLEADLSVVQPLTQPTPGDAKPHYAMMDGSMVLVRQAGWRELKLGRLFAESACYKDKKRGVISASHYVAHLGGHEEFLAKFEQTLAHKTDLIALGDGARWIWDFWDTHHPQAVQILDYYHAVEKLGAWAMLAFKDVVECQDWLKLSESLLLENNVEEVQAMIEGIDCQGFLAEKRHQLLTYLGNNSTRMHYKTYLEQGLFIGSGAMESANKSVIQKRLKLSGQRWTPSGVQQVATLRVTFKNEQWSQLVSHIKSAA